MHIFVKNNMSSNDINHPKTLRWKGKGERLLYSAFIRLVSPKALHRVKGKGSFTLFSLVVTAAVKASLRQTDRAMAATIAPSGLLTTSYILSHTIR